MEYQMPKGNIDVLLLPNGGFVIVMSGCSTENISEDRLTAIKEQTGAATVICLQDVVSVFGLDFEQWNSIPKVKLTRSLSELMESGMRHAGNYQISGFYPIEPIGGESFPTKRRGKIEGSNTMSEPTGSENYESAQQTAGAPTVDGEGQPQSTQDAPTTVESGTTEVNPESNNSSQE